MSIRISDATIGVSRRDFLRRGAGSLAGLAMAGAGVATGSRILGAALEPHPGPHGGLQDHAPQAEPHLNFPTEPRARLAVASYPFRAFIESPSNHDRDASKPGMDLAGFAKTVVEHFKVPGIEPLADHFPSRDAAALATLRAAFEHAGVHVVNIPVDLGRSFYDPDETRRRAAVEAGKQWVDTALAIGSPSIRTHVARVRGVTPDVNRTARSLTELADYGAAHNVIINLENDDLVSEDAFFLVRVIDQVNHPYLHALPDFGNSAMTGDPAFNLDALTVMFRHAYNISHMKDSEEGDGGRIYNADVPATFEIARASGYRGYFSMEWDRSGDPYEGTASLIAKSLAGLKA